MYTNFDTIHKHYGVKCRYVLALLLYANAMLVHVQAKLHVLDGGWPRLYQKSQAGWDRCESTR